jgi:hypothetical protein
MDELDKTELEKGKDVAPSGTGRSLLNAFKRKPGPEKKENPRTEKVSCRLTKEERAEALHYCRTHHITEAKLLRASFLAVINEPPGSRFDRLVDTFMQPMDSIDLHPDQKQTIRLKIKETLRKSTMALLLVLLCGCAAPTIIKAFWFIYEKGKELIFQDDTACVYYGKGAKAGKDGCEVMPESEYERRVEDAKPYCPPVIPPRIVPTSPFQIVPENLSPQILPAPSGQYPPALIPMQDQKPQIPATPLQQK